MNRVGIIRCMFKWLKASPFSSSSFRHGNKASTGTCIINNSTGFLIVHLEVWSGKTLHGIRIDLTMWYSYWNSVTHMQHRKMYGFIHVSTLHDLWSDLCWIADIQLQRMFCTGSGLFSACLSISPGSESCFFLWKPFIELQKPRELMITELSSLQNLRNNTGLLKIWMSMSMVRAREVTRCCGSYELNWIESLCEDHRSSLKCVIMRTHL